MKTGARSAKCAALAVALLGAIAIGTARAQSNPGLWGRVNYFDVCNKGTIFVYMAAAYTRFNLLKARNEHVIGGWWGIEPGKCANAFELFNYGILGKGERLYIGLLIRNERGAGALTGFDAKTSARAQPTREAFCVRPERFRLEGTYETVTRCSGDYERMKFAFEFYRRPNIDQIRFTMTVAPTEDDWLVAEPIFKPAVGARKGSNLAKAPAPRAPTTAASARDQFPYALGRAVGDLARRLDKGFDDLKAGASNRLPRGSWRSKLPAPALTGYKSESFIVDWTQDGERLMTAHGFEYRGATLDAATRERIARALALNLSGFKRAVTKGSPGLDLREWCRRAGQDGVDLVEFRADGQKFEVSAVRLAGALTESDRDRLKDC